MEERKVERIFLVDVWLEGPGGGNWQGLNVFSPSPLKCFFPTMVRKLSGKCSWLEWMKMPMCNLHTGFVLCQFVSFFFFFPLIFASLLYYFSQCFFNYYFFIFLWHVIFNPPTPPFFFFFLCSYTILIKKMCYFLFYLIGI